MLPAGMILLWSGSIGSIPSGYVICDGNNGTPDPRDKFIVGAGDTYAVDAVGGNVNHNHTFTGDGHTHTIPGGVDIQSGINQASTTDSTQVTGTTDNANGLPPYHSLAYIMKT